MCLVPGKLRTLLAWLQSGVSVSRRIAAYRARPGWSVIGEAGTADERWQMLVDSTRPDLLPPLEVCRYGRPHECAICVAACPLLSPSPIAPADAPGFTGR